MSIVIRITITTVAGAGHAGRKRGRREEKVEGGEETFCPPELYCLVAGGEECLLDVFKINTPYVHCYKFSNKGNYF